MFHLVVVDDDDDAMKIIVVYTAANYAHSFYTIMMTDSSQRMTDSSQIQHSRRNNCKITK